MSRSTAIHPKALLISSLVALCFAGSTPALDVTPEVGAEGTDLRIDGVELTNDDPAVVLFAPDGAAGAVVGDLRQVQTSLYGTLGPSASVFGGQLEVWRGQRFDLPPQLFQGTEVAYLVQSPSWFIGRHLEPMTDSFTFNPKTPDTVAGPMVSQVAAVDLWPCFPLGGFGDFGLRIDIVIDGGGSGGGSTEPPPFSGGDKVVGVPASSVRTLNTAHLVLEMIAADHQSGPNTLTPNLLAADLAQVLNGTFGPLGLVASSQGSELKISQVDGDSQRGFVTVQLCAGGCD